ncbi:hypothetical protein [Polyangium fumosum]|uniref:Uncharacterized protein n=1 Tax=Polyangium fumosum TaxID=889272 RepID=A0A4U1J1H7_9BACT|nr:hypothetical protein [Polyangium fumosum]TKD00413.1 hypothetical protein E8A74_34530 [Polyangium fumosum]
MPRPESAQHAPKVAHAVPLPATEPTPGPSVSPGLRALMGEPAAAVVEIGARLLAQELGPEGVADVKRGAVRLLGALSRGYQEGQAAAPEVDQALERIKALFQR